MLHFLYPWFLVNPTHVHVPICILHVVDTSRPLVQLYSGLVKAQLITMMSSSLSPLLFLTGTDAKGAFHSPGTPESKADLKLAR